MSRSGYIDDLDEGWALWRGAVVSALRGRRGQVFLREMKAALDAMPVKRLIAYELEKEGEVCALGAVGKARGLDMSKIDPEYRHKIAKTFDIAYAMACEIMYENDEVVFGTETPESRFARMHQWVLSRINEGAA